MKLQSFVLIGRSGCGKGTQAKLLVDFLKQNDPEHTVLYSETGAEFRTFLEGESYTQKLAKKIADDGGLVPEFLAIHLWANRLAQDFTAQEHLVIDGTPRKYHEALVLDSVFDFYSLPRPQIIYLNVSDEWSRGRLMDRNRADDNQQDIENRLAWFNTSVLPTIEYYKKNPAYKFHDIDGERAISDIHRDIRKLVTL